MHLVRKWNCAVCGRLLHYDTVTKEYYCDCGHEIRTLTTEQLINFRRIRKEEIYIK